MISWIRTIASNFFKRSKKDKELFQSFLFHETITNPSLNLEDALNLYIKKYNLMIRTCIDEPENISVIRTKLQILEEMLLVEPEFRQNSQIADYVNNLRMMVDAFNSLTPECLKHMKEQTS
jgi:hypothetical protein